MSFSTGLRICGRAASGLAAAQKNAFCISLARGRTLSIKARCHRNDFLNLSATPQISNHVPYTTSTVNEDGVISRVWRGMGFTGKLKYKKMLLNRSGLRLYLCCVELADHEKFFEKFAMPDTFNSWFRITELHTWMAMVRLANEHHEGKFVRDCMIRNLWQDVDSRTKKLGNQAGMTARKEGIKLISHQFKNSLFAYDEGVLSHDRVLAGALWRNFFDRQCQDPEHLELMVHYVRKQLKHLDQQEAGVILTSGLVSFLPLEGDTEDSERNKVLLNEILNRI